MKKRILMLLLVLFLIPLVGCKKPTATQLGLDYIYEKISPEDINNNNLNDFINYYNAKHKDGYKLPTKHYSYTENFVETNNLTGSKTITNYYLTGNFDFTVDSFNVTVSESTETTIKTTYLNNKKVNYINNQEQKNDSYTKQLDVSDTIFRPSSFIELLTNNSSKDTKYHSINHIIDGNTHFIIINYEVNSGNTHTLYNYLYEFNVDLKLTKVNGMITTNIKDDNNNSTIVKNIEIYL